MRKIQVCLKGFVAREVDEDSISYQEVEWVHPIEMDEMDLEGTMYDVACMVLDSGVDHDWITVVAYDAGNTDCPPIWAIDFGRRYSILRPSPYGEDWPPVWDPSRDYWSRDEMPASLFFATSDEPSA